MSSLGKIFQQTRESKNILLTDAALGTHIKIQYLTAIEADDFSHMPAPIYARGFIRLYAEFLGLDPAPLLQSYGVVPTKVQRTAVLAGARSPAAAQPPNVAGSAPGAAAPVSANQAPPAPDAPMPAMSMPPVVKPVPVPAPSPVAASPARTIRERMQDAGTASAPDQLFHPALMASLKRYLPIGVGVLAVVVLLLSGLKHCDNKHSEPATQSRADSNETPPSRAAAGALRLAEEPPPPYLDTHR